MSQYVDVLPPFPFLGNIRSTRLTVFLGDSRYSGFPKIPSTRVDSTAYFEYILIEQYIWTRYMT